jgi:hypothetical protein
MGRKLHTAGIATLAAMLAAGAVVGTVAAERATVGHVVPGLGTYAGGAYCITQTPPWHTTTTPDSVTLWVDMGNGQTSQAGPYNLSNSNDNADMRSYMDRAVKIEECWNK